MSEDLVEAALQASGVDFKDFVDDQKLFENPVSTSNINQPQNQSSTVKVQFISDSQLPNKPLSVNASLQPPLVLNNNKFIPSVPLVFQNSVRPNITIRQASPVLSSIASPVLSSIKTSHIIRNPVNPSTVQLVNIQKPVTSSNQRSSSPVVLKRLLPAPEPPNLPNPPKVLKLLWKGSVSNVQPQAGHQIIINSKPNAAVANNGATANNVSVKQFNLHNNQVSHQQISPRLPSNQLVPINVLSSVGDSKNNNYIVNNKCDKQIIIAPNKNFGNYVTGNNVQKIMLNPGNLIKRNSSTPLVNLKSSNPNGSSVILTPHDNKITGPATDKKVMLKSEPLKFNHFIQNVNSPTLLNFKIESQPNVVGGNNANKLDQKVENSNDKELKTSPPQVKFKIGADEEEESDTKIDGSDHPEEQEDEVDEDCDLFKAIRELNEMNEKAVVYEAEIKAKKEEEERQKRLQLLLGEDVPIPPSKNKSSSKNSSSSTMSSTVITTPSTNFPSTFPILNDITQQNSTNCEKNGPKIFISPPFENQIDLTRDVSKPLKFIDCFTQRFGLRAINSNNAVFKNNLPQQSPIIGPGFSNPLQLHNNNNLSMSSSSPSLYVVEKSGKYLLQDANHTLGQARSALLNRSNLQRMNMNLFDEEVEEEELGHAETYSDYMPTKLKMGCKHPDPVVESASLSSVESPDVTYCLSIPDICIERGLLSAVQLESITYACQKHESLLPNGERVGFLVGDGAGVGKGRMIAGIIYENYLCGRRRSLWLSVSNDLKVDAERDLRDIGASEIEVHSLNKFKYAKISSRINGKVKKGVIFATYSSLIGESKINNKYRTRLKQLIQWLGKEFDGLIIFDECHRAKNLFPNGSSKPTKTGQTVVELQNKLPKSRVVYASATGASEPRNMAYMVRLGLWGPGTPFREFSDYIQAVEKRGVGAMEMVAMEMKQRGTYIARQLSFKGVSFHVEEVEISEEYINVYNKSVQLWVEARDKFQQAAELLGIENRVHKTMWGQFWSSHQRFFKYLCISVKVQHCVSLANAAIAKGKSVVIGLQSTGESRTLEMVDEKGDELNDFVSTAKGVFQKLVESHFPSPDRQGAVEYFTNGGLPLSSTVNNVNSRTSSPSVMASNKRKVDADPYCSKKMKINSSDENEDDDDKSSSSDDDDDDEDEDEDDSDGSESDSNPFARASDSDDDVPWMRKSNKKKKKKLNKKKVKKDKKKKKRSGKSNGKCYDDEDSGSEDENSDEDDDEDYDKDVDRILEAFKKKEILQKSSVKRENSVDNYANVEKVLKLKQQLLDKIELLGRVLPANALDDLIDKLGGTSHVAEMTGRKGRIVCQKDGTIRYERRSEMDVPLEIINLTEKQRFMDGEKDIAIISEAASSGISLQADRRVANQKRRVHITLELPWSADRAIQQFGRTHRSNQVSAPEYIFLISELAGERRFASTVAKRLECLGALTQGDRRAAETRDLSQFNIDNKYGQTALEAVMKSVISHDNALVPTPSHYSGNFFLDVQKSLVGVGLLNPAQNGFSLDKESYNISKFLNRILGIEVETQNALFEYFTSTMKAIVMKAKRDGKWDLGILDLGSSGEKVVEQSCRDFHGLFSGFKTKVTLNKISVERGLSWADAERLSELHFGNEDGFYESKQSFVDNRRLYVLALSTKRQHHSYQHKKELLFKIYKANTGLQSNLWTLQELKKKFNKVFDAERVKQSWEEQYNFSEHHCLHVFQYGQCHKASTCEIGRRSRIYHVLSGSVLSVWTSVERVLASLPSGQASRMQIIRLRTTNNRRIVGTLIHPAAIEPLTQLLSSGRIEDNHQQSALPAVQVQHQPSASLSMMSVRNNMSNNFHSASNLLNLPQNQQRRMLLQQQLRPQSTHLLQQQQQQQQPLLQLQLQQQQQQLMQQQLQNKSLQQQYSQQQQLLQQQRLRTTLLLNPQRNPSFNIKFR